MKQTRFTFRRKWHWVSHSVYLRPLPLLLLAALAAEMSHASTNVFNFDSNPSAALTIRSSGDNRTLALMAGVWFPTNGSTLETGVVNQSTNGYFAITQTTPLLASHGMGSTIVFANFDNGSVVAGFSFSCDVRIGAGSSTPADGFSINFARTNDPAISADTFLGGPNNNPPSGHEEGTTTGLVISFDAFANSGSDPIGLTVKVDGTVLTNLSLSTLDGACTNTTSLQTGPTTGNVADLCWQPLNVNLDVYGLLSVSYKGATLLTNFPAQFTPSAGRFILAGRTGGLYEEQDVDNIRIVTFAPNGPSVVYADSVDFILDTTGTAPGMGGVALADSADFTLNTTGTPSGVGGVAFTDSADFALDTRLLLFVTTLADSGPGSLRQAIVSSGTYSNIVFLPGLSGVITLTSGELTITNDLTIAGPGANLLTVSGNNSSRVFHITGGPVSISGLKITGGNTASDGGGILVEDLLTLSNCIVAGNVAQGGGGGIANYGGLWVIASTICSNSAGVGGGIDDEGEASLTNSTICYNSAAYGGGILTASYSYLTSCTVASNTATTDGGGIRSLGAIAAHLGNTIVAGNAAPRSPDIDSSLYVASHGFNLVGVGFSNSPMWLASDQVGSTNAPLRPLLGPLQDNGGPTPTMALMAGSPAIDKGRGFPEVLDQQQTNIDGVTGSTDQWQSFTAGQSGWLTKIALSLVSPLGSNSSPAAIRIYVGEGTNGMLVSTASINIATNHDFQEFKLSALARVVLGSLYTIRVSVPAANGFWLDFISRGDPTAYPGGRYSANQDWDLVFKTYIVPDNAIDQRGRTRPSDFSTIANANGGDGSDIGAFELILPSLEIARLPAQIVVSWSTNEPGYALESTTVLPGSSGTWTAVPGIPSISGGRFAVTNNSSAGNKFYRLRQ